MQELKALAKNLINLLYPLRCFGCGSQLDALDDLHVCGRCIASIKPNAMPPFELDADGVLAYSAAIYEGVLKELLHSYKYKGKLALVPLFIKLMAGHIRENPELAAADLITAVPLHSSRMREREFNQSLLLANGLSKEFNIRTENILEKTARTKYQNELTKSERAVNLRGAFKAHSGAAIDGKNILLIDDVLTTGATLSECSSVLIKDGAKKVACLTLARGI